jgi:flagellar basal body-associated protein FliL
LPPHDTIIDFFLLLKKKKKTQNHINGLRSKFMIFFFFFFKKKSIIMLIVVLVVLCYMFCMVLYFYSTYIYIKFIQPNQLSKRRKYMTQTHATKPHQQVNITSEIIRQIWRKFGQSNHVSNQRRGKVGQH